jgi:G3E family GTPase
MAVVPLFIVSGFIGSGKTTFLSNIADLFHGERKIAIIQTEFPLSNVDRSFKDIIGKSVALLELNRGSVSNLSLSRINVSQIIDFIDEVNPEVVFLELSGLADLHSAVNFLANKDIRKRLFFCKSYVIADATRFEHEVSFLARVKRQLRFADCILINKIEKLNRLESPEKIVNGYMYNKIESGIRKISPHSSLLPTLYSRLPQEETNYMSMTTIDSYSLNRKVVSYCFEEYLSDDIRDELFRLFQKSFRTKGYITFESESVVFKFIKEAEPRIETYNMALVENEFIVDADISLLDKIGTLLNYKY